jgi:TetR/AcrR family transcriptional repressor of nem operon
MRYDTEHKERTRKRVLREAANAIRAEGPDRIGVAGLMAKAGLTHGGFYAHFKSKDDLIAQAITQMFDDRYEHWVERTKDLEPATALDEFVDGYLSARHRDDAEHGCPLPTLSGELARMTEAARQRFYEGGDRMTKLVATLLKRQGIADAHDLALSLVSEMVGAVALSRAMTEPARSTRILKASRDAIKARIAERRGAAQ